MIIKLTETQWQKKLRYIEKRNLKKYGKTFSKHSLEEQLIRCFKRSNGYVLLDLDIYKEVKNTAGLWGIVYFKINSSLPFAV